MLLAALTAIIGSAHASDTGWRNAVDRLQEDALKAQESADCSLRPTTDPWIRSLLLRSNEVFSAAGPYGVEGAGEGASHLDEDPETQTDYNCTTAVEATLSPRGDLADLRAIRYLRGWEGTFFGRAHYYETFWRTNALARGLLKDVSACVEGAGSYSYKLDAGMWNLMLEGNLKPEPFGRSYLAGRHGDLPPACKDARKLAGRLDRDWRGPALPALSCAKAADRRNTRSALAGLLSEIESETAASLKRKPVLTPTPWIPVRNSEGKLTFDANRDLPAGWSREGQILFVAFVASKPHAAFSDNPHYVKHQGTLLFRGGRWWLRHSSSDRIGQPKGMTELPFQAYLESKPWLSGINLLAPAEHR